MLRNQPPEPLSPGRPHSLLRSFRLWQILTISTLSLGLFLVGSAYLGWLQGWYMWVYSNTLGYPWTYYMRAHPWVLIVPECLLMAALAKFLPRRYWAVVVLIESVWFMGLLAGHVIWYH